jgi:hypothetical protein
VFRVQTPDAVRLKARQNAYSGGAMILVIRRKYLTTSHLFQNSRSCQLGMPIAIEESRTATEAAKIRKKPKTEKQPRPTESVEIKKEKRK